MSCPYERECPACCRMLAYDEVLGVGLCGGGNHVLCARFRRYARGEQVPVTLLPSGAELDRRNVEAVMVGSPVSDRKAATLGASVVGGALKLAWRASRGR